MTDLEEWWWCYLEWGFEPRIDAYKENINITLEQGTPKMSGYGGFVFLTEFTLDGKFVEGGGLGMTWKEFKEQCEEQGITDDVVIDFIDVGRSSVPEVYIYSDKGIKMGYVI